MSETDLKPMRKKRKNGFTLIELLVVIVIIGLLTTIVVVNVLPNVDTAASTTARTQISQLSNALAQYKLDNFSYPSTEQGLDALVRQPDDLRNPERYRRGGYLRDGLPKDPWGNDFQYIFPGENGDFDLFSYGADGREGGEGLNADVTNWRDDSQP